MKKIIIVLVAILMLGVGIAWAEGIAPTMRDVGFIMYTKYLDFKGLQAANVSNITFANVSLQNSSLNVSPNYIDILTTKSGGDLVIRAYNSAGTLTEQLRIYSNKSTGNSINFTGGSFQIYTSGTSPTNAGPGTVFWNSTSNAMECFNTTSIRVYCDNGSGI